MSARAAKFASFAGGRQSQGKVKGLVVSLFGLAALAVAYPVEAQQSASPPPAVNELVAAADQETTYVFHVRDGNSYEIASSRLALERSRNRAIRAHAQMMISDHTRMMQELASIARPGTAAADRDLSEPKSQMLETLRMSRGRAFEDAYVRGQIAAHEEALALHRACAANSSGGALREFALRAAPIVEAHLTRARALRPGSR